MDSNNNKYSAIMASKSDEELVRIVLVQRADYQQEAVMSAEVELKKRNLSESYLEELQNTWSEISEKDQEKLTAPLGTGVKIWVFIFPILLNFIFAFTYKADGYDRKTKEVWKWTLYGLGFYCGLFLLIMLFLRIMN